MCTSLKLCLICLFYMYECFAWIHICALRGQKRVLEPTELELNGRERLAGCWEPNSRPCKISKCSEPLSCLSRALLILHFNFLFPKTTLHLSTTIFPCLPDQNVLPCSDRLQPKAQTVPLAPVWASETLSYIRTQFPA